MTGGLYGFFAQKKQRENSLIALTNKNADDLKQRDSSPRNDFLTASHLFNVKPAGKTSGFFPASATLPFRLSSSESIFLIKPTLEVRTSIFTISHDLIMKLVQILSDSF
ncbi:hypothetical protein K7Z10_13730 [Bacillus licheniformis]|nr:hypothetical protein [Bacillus licheniformis]